MSKTKQILVSVHYSVYTKKLFSIKRKKNLSILALKCSFFSQNKQSKNIKSIYMKKIASIFPILVINLWLELLLESLVHLL